MNSSRPETLSGRRASQDLWELRAFGDLMVSLGVRRYLELGARHGDTFFAVMTRLERGSMGVGVDFPGGAWGVASSARMLQRAVMKLISRGYDAHAIFGSSHDADTQRSVQLFGRFDLVLIDADHRYGPVRQDWDDYSTLARFVAFHDIAGNGETTKDGSMPVEVPRLWSELKPRFGQTWEFVGEGSKMGIGVIDTETRKSDH